MPYSSEVRVSSQSGSPLSGTVALTLWEIWTAIDNLGRVHDQQVDSERVTTAVAGGAPTAFSMTRGPDFKYPKNHDISLAAYQDPHPGPIFRSGRFDTLPPGSPGDRSHQVDVMLLDPVRFTIAEINSIIQGQLPITLSDGNVISTAIVTSAPPSRILTLTATGPFGRTTYTYTLLFTIDPSDDQVDLSNVLGAYVAGPPTVTFAAGPGGGFQALIDNILSGFFEPQITRRAIAWITGELNNRAASAAADAAGNAGLPGGLPTGVILGVRSVGIAPNGDIVVRPAIGTFGDIIIKFLDTGPSKRCFVATAIHGADSIEVSTLRIYRDKFLSTSRKGRVLVGLYERLSPVAAALVARNRALRLIARKLIVSPAYHVASRRLARTVHR
jgi:hypothetical protein